MAKATLPTNYQDDILKSTMNGKRRYTMTDNNDGTKTLEDATQYDKVGSNFGAADINKTNTAVNASADASKIIDNVDDIKANTQAGYITGAKVAKEIISDLTALWEAVYPPIFYYIKDSLRIVPGFGLEPRGNQSNTPGMDADYTSGIQELKEGHNKLQITVSYFTSTNSAQGFSFGIAVKADGVEIASGLSMPTTGIMHIVDLPSNATNFEILFKIRANSCSVTWGFSDIHTFKQ